MSAADAPETAQESAQEALRALQERLLGGDMTVTAEELAQARQAAEYASLVAEAEQRRQAAEVEQRLEADRDRVRHEWQTLESAGLDPLRAAYGTVVATTAELRDGITEWKRQHQQLRARARAVGIESEIPTRPPLVARDFVALALEEASGRPDRRYDRRSGALQSRPHVLHDEATVARLAEANEDAVAVTLDRRRARDARAKQEGENRAAFERRVEERAQRAHAEAMSRLKATGK